VVFCAPFGVFLCADLNAHHNKANTRACQISPRMCVHEYKHTSHQKRQAPSHPPQMDSVGGCECKPHQRASTCAHKLLHPPTHLSGCSEEVDVGVEVGVVHHAHVRHGVAREVRALHHWHLSSHERKRCNKQTNKHQGEQQTNNSKQRSRKVVHNAHEKCEHGIIRTCRSMSAQEVQQTTTARATGDGRGLNKAATSNINGR
jgi:hypothetical protein